jgi:hypothetical protein
LNGLTVEQEAALAYLYLHQDDPFGQPVCKKHSRGATTLRERGLIKAEADFSGHVYFQNLTTAGAAHYDTARTQRRAFRAFGDDADELALELAAEDKVLKKAGETQFVTVDENRIVDYWTLKRHGLIDGLPASDTLMAVSVTDDGRSYAEGWFLDQMSDSSITNNFNPEIRIDNSSGSTSSASATTGDVTLGATVGAIIDLDIDESVRSAAQTAVSELNDAAKAGNKLGFAEKLEKIASIAKSSAELAPILLSFARTAIGTLLGAS